jgi:hypothetical protein
VELTQVELCAELLFRFLAQIENAEHPDLVGGGLARHDDIAVDRIDAVRFGVRRVLLQIIDRLLARPFL